MKMEAKKRKLENNQSDTEEEPEMDDQTEPEMEPQISILSLPNEILFEIFQYLTWQEHNKVATICKRFYSICRHPSLPSPKRYGKAYRLESAPVDFLCGYLPITTLKIVIDNSDVNTVDNHYNNKYKYGKAIPFLMETAENRPEYFQCLDTLEVYYRNVTDASTLTKILALFPNVRTVNWVDFKSDAVLPELEALRSVMTNVKSIYFKFKTPVRVLSQLIRSAVNLNFLKLKHLENLELDPENCQPLRVHALMYKLTPLPIIEAIDQKDLKIVVDHTELNFSLSNFVTREQVLKLTKYFTHPTVLTMKKIEYFDLFYETKGCSFLFPLFTKVKKLDFWPKDAMEFETLEKIFQKCFLAHNDWSQIKCINFHTSNSLKGSCQKLDDYLISFKKMAPNLRKISLGQIFFWNFLEADARIFHTFESIEIRVIDWNEHKFLHNLSQIALREKSLEVNIIAIDCEYLNCSKALDLFRQFSEAVYRVDTLIICKPVFLTPELLETLTNLSPIYPIKDVIFDNGKLFDWRDEYRVINSLNYYKYLMCDHDALVKVVSLLKEPISDSATGPGMKFRNRLQLFHKIRI